MSQKSWAISPVFLVDDVVSTANYYRDKLGFTYERIWGEPPAYCMVERAGIVVSLNQFPREAPMRPNHLADPEGEAWDVYVDVDDVNELFDEFSKSGVNIVRGLCDQFYGNRDFEVEDCNGYRLCFGQELSE